MTSTRAGVHGRAAAYVRVSTVDQRSDLQRDDIVAGAAARGDDIVAWYEEQASAKTTARRALDALRRDVRAGKLKTVYVWKLDRLCRSGIRDAFTLVDEFRAAGCIVVSLRDPFDLAGPAGDLLLAVFAWAAQIEREFISARVKAGLAAARRRGTRIGRPRRVFDLGRARALLAAGQSKRAVARVLGVGEATLRGVLRERAESPPLAMSRGPAESLASPPPVAVRGKV